MHTADLRIDVEAALAIVDLKDAIAAKVQFEARKLARSDNSSVVTKNHVLRAVPVAIEAVKSAFSVLEPEEVVHDRRRAA